MIYTFNVTKFSFITNSLCFVTLIFNRNLSSNAIKFLPVGLFAAAAIGLKDLQVQFDIPKLAKFYSVNCSLFMPPFNLNIEYNDGVCHLNILSFTKTR